MPKFKVKLLRNVEQAKDVIVEAPDGNTAYEIAIATEAYYEENEGWENYENSFWDADEHRIVKVS